jgi:hypothetical protein
MMNEEKKTDRVISRLWVFLGRRTGFLIITNDLTKDGPPLAPPGWLAYRNTRKTCVKKREG